MCVRYERCTQKFPRKKCKRRKFLQRIVGRKILLKMNLKETEYKVVRVDSCGSRWRLVTCSSKYGNNEALISIRVASSCLADLLLAYRREFYLISGFRCKVDENGTLLGCYAARSFKILQFRVY